MQYEGLQTVVDGGPIPAHLTTGYLVGDVFLGVGVAVTLFGLYYWTVLRPARQRSSRPNRSSRNETTD
jgi:uncharacterized protein (DUF2062 family)